MTEEFNNERNDVTIEAEQSILAALMNSSNAIDRVDFLREEHFDLKQHRQIFAAIRKVADRGDTPEQSIIYDAMHSAGQTDTCVDSAGVTRVKTYTYVSVGDNSLVASETR